MLKRNSLLITLLLSLVIISCATTGQQVMTQKQQATVWMDMYNAQYDDTYTIMTSPASTESQKAIGRQKKAILTEVWPLLKIYASIVEQGKIATPEQTAQITNLMNRLTSIATGGH